MPLLILFIIIALVLKSVFWALVMLFVIGVAYMFQTKTEQVVIQPSDCNKNTNTSQNTASQPQIKDELDKKIPTSELIQIRDILNSFDFKKAFTYNARNLLIKRLLQVESSQFTNEHASEIKKLDLEFAKQFFLDLKKVLNSKKLKQSEYITSREVFPEVMPAEELEYLVSKISSDNEYEYTENNYYEADNYNNEVEDDDDDKIEDMLDELTGLTIGTSAAETYTSYKSNKKSKKDVYELEREYEFERGYDSDWDEDDRLSDRYKNNEEKYYEARKYELEERNRSYDTYLSSDEREDEDMF